MKSGNIIEANKYKSKWKKKYYIILCGGGNAYLNYRVEKCQQIKGKTILIEKASHEMREIEKVA